MRIAVSLLISIFSLSLSLASAQTPTYYEQRGGKLYSHFDSINGVNCDNWVIRLYLPNSRSHWGQLSAKTAERVEERRAFWADFMMRYAKWAGRPMTEQERSYSVDYVGPIAVFDEVPDYQKDQKQFDDSTAGAIKIVERLRGIPGADDISEVRQNSNGRAVVQQMDFFAEEMGGLIVKRTTPSGEADANYRAGRGQFKAQINNDNFEAALAAIQRQMQAKPHRAEPPPTPQQQPASGYAHKSEWYQSDSKWGGIIYYNRTNDGHTPESPELTNREIRYYEGAAASFRTSTGGVKHRPFLEEIGTYKNGNPVGVLINRVRSEVWVETFDSASDMIDYKSYALQSVVNGQIALTGVFDPSAPYHTKRLRERVMVPLTSLPESAQQMVREADNDPENPR